MPGVPSYALLVFYGMLSDSMALPVVFAFAALGSRVPEYMWRMRRSIMLSIGIGLDWGGGWRFFFWEYWKDAKNAKYDLKRKLNSLKRT